MSDRETFKLTFEERAKAEQEYGRACDEPEEVAFELVALRSRIDAALAKAEPSLRSREGWGVVREMVEALKGEK